MAFQDGRWSPDGRQLCLRAHSRSGMVRTRRLLQTHRGWRIP
jgi:hypothetical protein